MVFIFGKRMLGKCDHVPGLFHVSTQFFHIDYLPLIPVQTWLVLSQSGNQFRGIQIPMSGKSILCAWGRVGSFIATIIFGVIAMIQIAGGSAPVNEWLIPAIGTALCGSAFGFLMWHPFCTKASLARATQLGQLIGLNAAGHARIQEIYGQSAGRGFEVIPTGSFHQAAGFDAEAPERMR